MQKQWLQAGGSGRAFLSQLTLMASLMAALLPWSVLVSMLATMLLMLTPAMVRIAQGDEIVGPVRTDVAVSASPTELFCAVTIEPDRFRGDAPPPALAFFPTATMGLGMRVVRVDAKADVTILDGDRRVSVADIQAESVLALLQQLSWLPPTPSRPLHLTVTLATRGHRTARFDKLSLLQVLDRLQETCGLVPNIGAATADCSSRRVAALLHGWRHAQALLQGCRDEKGELERMLNRCLGTSARNQRERLEQALRALPGVVGDGDAMRWSVAALVEAVDRLRDPLQLASARVRIRELDRRNEDLQRRHRAATEVPDGLVEPEQVKALLRDIIGPGRCDAVTIEAGEAEGMRIRITAASEVSARAMSPRLQAIAKILGGKATSLELVPGGRCRKPLSEDWTIIPNLDGRIARIGEFENLVAPAVLPKLHELMAMNTAAADHPVLAPYFAAGQTPTVWCRRGAVVGICKRDPNANLWQLHRNGNYSGFILLPNDPERLRKP